MMLPDDPVEFRAIAISVGIPNERADDIVAQAEPTNDRTDLVALVGRYGYYAEKADHLMDAGVGFVG